MSSALVVSKKFIKKFGIMAWLEGENDENSKPVKDKSK